LAEVSVTAGTLRLDNLGNLRLVSAQITSIDMTILGQSLILGRLWHGESVAQLMMTHQAQFQRM